MVNQDEIAIIQSKGKYLRTGTPGPLILFHPCNLSTFEEVVGRLSSRIKQLNVTTTTKTLENAIVTMQISLQYQLDQTKVYEAWYAVEDNAIEKVLNPVTSDLVRGFMSKTKLDDLYLSSERIHEELMRGLREKVDKDKYGYEIVHVLVTDIEPAREIKNSMNQIYLESMNKVAKEAKSESQKILDVKRAEALAERSYWLGEGTARMREAIASGLEATTQEFCDALNRIDESRKYTSDDVLYLQVLMQQFDTFKEMRGHNPQAPTVLAIPTSVDAVAGLRSGIRFG